MCLNVISFIFIKYICFEMLRSKVAINFGTQKQQLAPKWGTCVITHSERGKEEGIYSQGEDRTVKTSPPLNIGPNWYSKQVAVAVKVLKCMFCYIKNHYKAKQLIETQYVYWTNLTGL